MTNFQQCRQALTGSACPKKATELLYVPHPKVLKTLLGPFVTEADTECGRVVVRSPGTVVTSALFESVNDFTHRHAMNNGQVMQAFAGAAQDAT